MVNFNAGPLALEAAEAVLASNLPLELLIADNASTDASLPTLRGLAERDARVTLIENPRNLGFAAAINPLLSAATADWLLLLNPDCLLQPDTLQRMLELVQDWPCAGMIGCRILNPDGSEQRGCRRRLPTLASGLGTAIASEQLGINQHRDPVPVAPLLVEAISGALMLVRREALEQVGPLDEGYFLHCEDLDWCRRFADAGWQILFLPQIEVVHHQGSCGVKRPWRVEWHKHQGMRRYARKFLVGTNPFLSRLLALGLDLAILGRWGGVALTGLLRRSAIKTSKRKARE